MPAPNDPTKGDSTGDPYRELGVSVGADPRFIRSAYLAKARAHHPDLGGTVDQMARLNAAYELLSDPQRRATYDGDPDVQLAKKRAREPWTGSAGRPPGRPSGSVVDFGIFAGWSLGEIARYDPGYLVWLAERKEGQPYAAEIQALVAPMIEQARSSSAPARR